jgi:hypothetical protein
MAEHELPPPAHEMTDVAVRPVLIGLVLTAIMLGSLAGLAFWLYPISDRRIALPLPRDPEPRLQADPAADMQALLARELQRLHATGWVDRAHGIAHIPIEAAMQEVAHRGIPDWPRSP